MAVRRRTGSNNGSGDEDRGSVLRTPPRARADSESGSSVGSVGSAMSDIDEHAHSLASPFHTQPFLQEADAPYQWMYRPHTIIGLVVTLAFTMYMAFVREPEETYEGRLRVGLAAMFVVFLMYCLIQLRDGVILRPHPALWRLVHGTAIVYNLCAVMVLLQTKDDARKLMRFFSPTLAPGEPADNSKFWVEDCRVSNPEDPNGRFHTVLSVSSDIFVVSHTLGWIGKALMVRDWGMLWVLCILWEVIEYSTQHVLTNFYECWWDHWILDTFICNGAGMVIGMWMCRQFKVMTYDWTGHSDIHKYKGKTTMRDRLVQVAGVFRPREWTEYAWGFFGDLRSFLSALGIIVVMEIAELNAFVLKHVLWIPTSNPICVFRIVTWWAISLPALREYYQYRNDPECNRLGPNMWLVLGMTITECAIGYKFGSELLDIPTPPSVIYSWAAFGLFITAWAIMKFNVSSLIVRIRENHPREFSYALNSVLVLALLPIAWMCWAEDVGYGKSAAELHARIDALRQ